MIRFFPCQTPSLFRQRSNLGGRARWRAEQQRLDEQGQDKQGRTHQLSPLGNIDRNAAAVEPLPLKIGTILATLDRLPGPSARSLRATLLTLQSKRPVKAATI